MAYDRVNWENEPSEETPINSDNLNQMDEGIKDNDNRLDDIEDGGIRAYRAFEAKRLVGKWYTGSLDSDESESLLFDGTEDPEDIAVIVYETTGSFPDVMTLTTDIEIELGFTAGIDAEIYITNTSGSSMDYALMAFVVDTDEPYTS